MTERTTPEHIRPLGGVGFYNLMDGAGYQKSRVGWVPSLVCVVSFIAMVAVMVLV